MTLKKDAYSWPISTERTTTDWLSPLPSCWCYACSRIMLPMKTTAQYQVVSIMFLKTSMKPLLNTWSCICCHLSGGGPILKMERKPEVIDSSVHANTINWNSIIEQPMQKWGQHNWSPTVIHAMPTDQAWQQKTRHSMAWHVLQLYNSIGAHEWWAAQHSSIHNNWLARRFKEFFAWKPQDVNLWLLLCNPYETRSM